LWFAASSASTISSMRRWTIWLAAACPPWLMENVFALEKS
jgi:hypothetical protein